MRVKPGRWPVRVGDGCEPQPRTPSSSRDLQAAQLGPVPGLLRPGVAHGQLVEPGREPADPRGRVACRDTTRRAGAEPARPVELGRQVEAGRRPAARCSPSPVTGRPRRSSRQAVVADAASGSATSTTAPLLAAADPDAGPTSRRRPDGRCSTHPVDQPVEPALAPALLRRRTGAPSPCGVLRRRQLVRAAAGHCGRCRSAPATAPAAARRPPARTGWCSRPVSRSNSAGPSGRRGPASLGRTSGRRARGPAGPDGRGDGVSANWCPGHDVPGRRPGVSAASSARTVSQVSPPSAASSRSGRQLDLGRSRPAATRHVQARRRGRGFRRRSSTADEAQIGGRPAVVAVADRSASAPSRLEDDRRVDRGELGQARASACRRAAPCRPSRSCRRARPRRSRRRSRRTSVPVGGAGQQPVVAPLPDEAAVQPRVAARPGRRTRSARPGRCPSRARTRRAGTASCGPAASAGASGS